MRQLAFLFLFLSLIAPLVSPAKILAIAFFSSKSHKITYMTLLEELAERGHSITIVTPVQSDKPSHRNIKEVFTFDLMKKLEGQFDPFAMKESGETPNVFVWMRQFSSFCDEFHDLPQVQALQKETFDLIFFQPFFNDCVLGLVWKLKAPLVLFGPVAPPSFLVRKIGGHLPPSFVSTFVLGYPDEMTFFQRFLNFGSEVFMAGVIQLYHQPFVEAQYREKLGDPSIPGIDAILGNASLILTNSHFSLNRPKPYLPDVVEVGGIHQRPAKPLPKDLEDFVSSFDGFILFSMGSAISGKMMSVEKRNLFLSVFASLLPKKIGVLWKWESETMGPEVTLPKNVKLSKWLPQPDLLGHPKIRMFITHCGGGSTEEAIYHGVPLVGLPMFGDQDMNARTSLGHGILVNLEWNKLTEEDLRNAIQEVLTNKKYVTNVKRLSAIFRDQPNSPLERGVYWMEYVLRHKGAPHLRSAARNLNFFQYHSLDVIGAYVALILGILYVIYAILRFIGRKVCGLFCKKSNVVESKKKKQ